MVLFSKPHIFRFDTCLALAFPKRFCFHSVKSVLLNMTDKGATADFKYEISLIVDFCREKNQFGNIEGTSFHSMLRIIFLFPPLLLVFLSRSLFFSLPFILITQILKAHV